MIVERKITGKSDFNQIQWMQDQRRCYSAGYSSNHVLVFDMGEYSQITCAGRHCAATAVLDCRHILLLFSVNPGTASG